MRMSISVSPNLATIIAKLQGSNGRITEMVRAQVHESAMNVVNEAKRIAPVATGAYRDSITWQQAGEMGALIGSWVPYAPPLEFIEVDHPVIARGSTYVPQSAKGISVGKARKAYKKMNTNPDATWGGLRKALAAEEANFIEGMDRIARSFLD